MTTATRHPTKNQRSVLPSLLPSPALDVARERGRGRSHRRCTWPFSGSHVKILRFPSLRLLLIHHLSVPHSLTRRQSLKVAHQFQQPRLGCGRMSITCWSWLWFPSAVASSCSSPQINPDAAPAVLYDYLSLNCMVSFRRRGSRRYPRNMLCHNNI